MPIAIKVFQDTAITNAVEFLDAACQQLASISDKAGKRKIISHNGCLLIEAPTGAGKTLIAGHTAERFSNGKKIVWFWFAPFAGLVEQSIRTIKNEFPGLTVKDPRKERSVDSVKSGDVFVTTWGTVAANNAESRKARTRSDTTLSLDELVPALKGLGFQLGVIVDEAHHGFKKAPEALAFYMNVLAPEYTLMVTATPKDRDIEVFKENTGFAEVHKIGISRQECIDADLKKSGVEVITFLVDDEAKNVTDFEKTAIRHGLEKHLAIENELEKSGINLKPLMLVQVDSQTGRDTVAEARHKLLELGVKPGQIAVHTAQDPDPDLLAMAKDDNIRVLIFKVAVALGFDCPRAFTLVSMRKSRDVDFGVQVVGRILRVHRLLQGKQRNRLLNHGYVVLADFPAQEGLNLAADRLKSIETQLAEVSSNVAIIGIGNEELQVRTVIDGQTSFWEKENSEPATFQKPADPFGNAATAEDTQQHPHQPLLIKDGSPPQVPSRPLTVSRPANTAKFYDLRTDIVFPRVFKREVCNAEMVADLAADIASQIRLDGEIMNVVYRRFSQAVKRTTEIFDKHIDTEQATADISMKEIALKAQKLLFEDENISGRPLHDLLIKRLKDEFIRKGWAQNSPQEIEEALSLILATYPETLREARRRCYSKFIEAAAAAPIPDFISSEKPLEPSKLNLYKVFPEGLTTDERNFALLLDSDTTGTVLWWHRNPQNKPYTVSLVMPDLKYDYHPDFVIGVRNRKTENHILLVEIKGEPFMEMPQSVAKARAVHKIYQRVMMLHWQNQKQWQTVANDSKGQHNILDQNFRIELLPAY
jgi:superfamily II DNA or RNA helicase